MRFAIYGSGGLGAYYGIRLQQAGHDVVFVARGAHLEAIRANGLRLNSPLGDAHLTDLSVSDDPASLGQVDAVLVAVKTWQIPDVASQMAPLLKDDTVVVPFLNGVEAAQQIADVIGAGKVLGGLSKIFSFIEAPGVIKHFSPQAIIAFGEMNAPPTDRCKALKAAFDAAGVEAYVETDIQSELWKKLLMVGSWSGLSALNRSPLGELRDFEPTRALIDAAMGEGIAVARAMGVGGIDEGYKDTLWQFYADLPDGATSSMARDIWDGKPSELDAWNGAIHRFGVECGVPTPVHSFTYHALLPMERRARSG